MPADITPPRAAPSPRRPTKSRCPGPVQTVSNNTSALTLGDLARARAAKADEALGIAWWNAMSERARLAALKAVEPEGRASPAEAWAHWKEIARGFKCEEAVHG